MAVLANLVTVDAAGPLAISVGRVTVGAGEVMVAAIEATSAVTAEEVKIVGMVVTSVAWGKVKVVAMEATSAVALGEVKVVGMEATSAVALGEVKVVAMGRSPGQPHPGEPYNHNGMGSTKDPIQMASPPSTFFA
ncbi:hypothetical protein VOLCADRAFT_97001 [Volvox carteri f. nagariensis]|uniref:Uncharacterized protein n=1 Tax=Volvox carteri f. nagariensis TaxID=3068 RepID=D8UBM4_VOLCA|nr:uncharacterized protein VOLCADRAFT_97001 [Volvox carteri f. nagariensis]EFJ42795.1 hypothetical protein VOLCADRAFT_97001 [Volvox carteri f. nagariensis]|eukprot:XP_002956055.1 hypothetical protein VOLCADRAFT_97001 [Volvox carteri f. nagariensis]